MDATTNFNSRTSQEVRRNQFKSIPKSKNFNSRTSQEVRPAELIKDGKVAKISTHVPHKRYDWIRFTQYRQQYRFQLTYLTRGTTKDLCPFIQRNNFNSRTSQEVRLHQDIVDTWQYVFQLTYLTRGTTANIAFNLDINNNICIKLT